MVDFKKLEEEAVSKAEAALKDVIHTAEANEPTIGQAVQTALEGAGVPPTLVGVAVGLVESLLAHFNTQPQPAPTTSPEPAQSSNPIVPQEGPAAPPFPDSATPG